MDIVSEVPEQLKDKISHFSEGNMKLLMVTDCGFFSDSDYLHYFL